MPTVNIITSTSDAYVRSEDTNYTTARTATAGDTISSADPAILSNELLASDFLIARFFMFYDLSAIPANAVVQSVQISLTVTNKDTTTDDNIQVVSGTQSDPVVLGDFDLVGSTGFVDSPQSYSGLTVNDPFTMEFNQDGIDAVQNALGTELKLALRTSKDLSATQPATRSFVQLNTAEQATEADRPTLTITYTALEDEVIGFYLN